MKKLVVFLLPLMLIISCEKENTDQGFKTLPVLDLRVNDDVSSSLKLVDYPDTINLARIDYPLDDTHPIYDTTGSTKVLLNGEELFASQWPGPFRSGSHSKTRVIYAYNEKVIIVFVSYECMQQHIKRGAIINSDMAVTYFDFPNPTQTIKKVEINEVDKKIKVTSNRTWWICGPYPDDLLIVKY